MTIKSLLTSKKILILLALPVIIFITWYGLSPLVPEKGIGPDSPTPTPDNSLVEPPLITPLVSATPQKTLYSDQATGFTIYYTEYNKFHLITITKSPFAEIRAKAENQFLKTLKITKDQACALTVQISTDYRVNPTEAKQTYRLSFCSPNP